jgi:hypothetical protein
MRDESVFLILSALLIISGVVLVLAAMMRRQRIVEMAHKERMAMIERGLGPVSPSQADPASALFLHDRTTAATRSRMLSGGIAVIGFGLGLMTLIGIAGGASDAAVGIGGAIMVLGASFVVIALVRGRDPEPPLPPPSYPPPSWPVPPPPPRRDGE